MSLLLLYCSDHTASMTGFHHTNGTANETDETEVKKVSSQYFQEVLYTKSPHLDRIVYESKLT